MISNKDLLGSWYGPLADMHDEVDRVRAVMQVRFHTPGAFFDCFRRTPYEKTNVVIMGKSPYPQEFAGIRMATGVALEHPSQFPITPSLRAFYEGIEKSLGHEVERSKDLQYLCDQGVLFINACLTTAPGVAGAHLKEWASFMKRFIYTLSSSKPVYFVFMGQDARRFAKQVGTIPFNCMKLETQFPLLYDNKESNYMISNMPVLVNQYLGWNNLPEIEWDRKAWEQQTKEQAPNGKEILST